MATIRLSLASLNSDAPLHSAAKTASNLATESLDGCCVSQCILYIVLVMAQRQSEAAQQKSVAQTEE